MQRGIVQGPINRSHPPHPQAPREATTPRPAGRPQARTAGRSQRLPPAPPRPDRGARVGEALWFPTRPNPPRTPAPREHAPRRTQRGRSRASDRADGENRDTARTPRPGFRQGAPPTGEPYRRSRRPPPPPTPRPREKGGCRGDVHRISVPPRTASTGTSGRAGQCGGATTTTTTATAATTTLTQQNQKHQWQHQFLLPQGQGQQQQQRRPQQQQQQ